jgi:cbb3-type cytochrome oxidase maturation protein
MLMPAAARACPFCQVGGERIALFALVVVGAFIAGAFLVLLWAARSGHFADPAATSRRVLELDRETGVRR